MTFPQNQELVNGDRFSERDLFVQGAAREGMTQTNTYAAIEAALRADLEALPRCRVREEALKVGLFIARTHAAYDRLFTFPREIMAGNKALLAACGEMTASRVRSCLKALIKLGWITQENEDTFFYRRFGKWKDTPNQYRSGSKLAGFFPETATIRDSQDESLEIVALKEALPPLKPKGKSRKAINAMLRLKRLTVKMALRKAEEALARTRVSRPAVAHSTEPSAAFNSWLDKLQATLAPNALAGSRGGCS